MTPNKLERRKILGFAALLAGMFPLVSPGPLEAAPATGRQPNFILILADDLGWTDLGSFGSTVYETPNIDRLAEQGMKFTQAYAACPVCSPTRASILTGKYPARLHVTDWIPGHERPWAKLKVPPWTKYLPLEEVTLAEALKAAGYATASIGKWHLGGEPYYPDKHGFDSNIAGTHRGQPPRYFSPYGIATLKDGPPGEYLTDREADEAIRFIERNKDRPFFLYLPHHAVHTPIQAKKDVTEKYRKKILPGGAHKDPAYAALVESVDDSVGRLMKTLEALKIADRTVIVFTSDNGGLIGKTSNVPLRVGKGSAYEGGVRVPLIVRWTGVTRPGGVCDVPVISPDLYPTLLEMAGGKPSSRQVVDGESLVSLLKGSGGLNRDTLYWHYPHYHPGGATPYSAIRQGDFKLIEFHEDHHVELYNLKADIGETNDLAPKMSEKAKELRGKLHDWRRQVKAQMPSQTPIMIPRGLASGPKKANSRGRSHEGRRGRMNRGLWIW